MKKENKLLDVLGDEENRENLTRNDDSNPQIITPLLSPRKKVAKPFVYDDSNQTYIEKVSFWKRSNVRQGVYYASWMMLFLNFLIETTADYSKPFDHYLETKNGMRDLVISYSLAILLVGLFPAVKNLAINTYQSCAGQKNPKDLPGYEKIQFSKDTELLLKGYDRDVKQPIVSKALKLKIADQNREIVKNYIESLPPIISNVLFYLAYITAVSIDKNTHSQQHKNADSNYFVKNFEDISFVANTGVAIFSYLVAACYSKIKEKSIDAQYESAKTSIQEQDNQQGLRGFLALGSRKF